MEIIIIIIIIIIKTFGFLAILSSTCKPAFSGCTVFLYLVVLKKNKIKVHHRNETGASKELKIQLEVPLPILQLLT